MNKFNLYCDLYHLYALKYFKAVELAIYATQNIGSENEDHEELHSIIQAISIYGEAIQALKKELQK